MFSFSRALCLTTMQPTCTYSSPYEGSLCREACHLIKDDICRKEWDEIITRISQGFLNIDNIFPNCSRLPSIAVSKSCLYPDLFKSKEFSIIFSVCVQE